MKACIYEEYGPADVVHLGEVATPVPEDDEVLVRVRATSVTTADWRFRSSTFSPVFWLPGRLMVGLFRPRRGILGMDFSGVVEAVGKNVTRFRVGDPVFGSTSATSLGAHAEYLTVEESGAIARKPSSLTDVQAAAMPFGANAALSFLRDAFGVKPGQRVLVVGASGGVGVWAVQIARYLGAEVTGAASAKNLELVQSLGAHHVVDYANGITKPGDRYDLIFDTVGATTFAETRDALTERGTYMPLECGLREILQAIWTSRSSGKRLKFGISKNTKESLETVTALVAAGVLRPVVDHVYPMSEIADAHRRVEGRHKRGSLVVTIP